MYRLSSIVDGEGHRERISPTPSREIMSRAPNVYGSSCMRGAEAEEGHGAGSQLNPSYNKMPMLINGDIKHPIHVSISMGVHFTTRKRAVDHHQRRLVRLHTGHHAIHRKSGRFAAAAPALVLQWSLLLRCHVVCVVYPQCLHVKVSPEPLSLIQVSPPLISPREKFCCTL